MKIKQSSRQQFVSLGVIHFCRLGLVAHQNEFLSEIEELKKMFKKVPHGCKETRRVILQQTNAHLN